MDVVPKVLRYGLYAFLAVAAVASWTQLSRRAISPLPVTTALDAAIIVVALWAVTKGEIRNRGILASLCVFALTRVVGVMLTDPPLSEALRAYRWLLFIIALAVVTGKRWSAARELAAATKVLLVLAAVNSVSKALLVGIDARPGLFIENNFEIPLFVGLTALTFHRLGRKRNAWVMLLGVTVLLSQSLSGVLTFALFVLYATWECGRTRPKVRLAGGFVIIPAALLVLTVFNARATAGADRMRFTRLFLREMDERTALNWLFGTRPITTLSWETCHDLGSWLPGLLSPDGSGQCYAVILHSQWLRMIFDVGLVGTGLALVVIWTLLRRAGVPLSLAILLTASVVINGLSVSSMNSPFIMLPVFLSVMMNGRAAVADSAPNLAGDSRVPIHRFDGRVAEREHVLAGMTTRPRSIRHTTLPRSRLAR